LRAKVRALLGFTDSYTTTLSTIHKAHKMVFSYKGNKKSYRQPVMHTLNCCNMLWTSLKYPLIKDPFLPRDLTHWDILRRSHFKGSSWVTYKEAYKIPLIVSVAPITSLRLDYLTAIAFWYLIIMIGCPQCSHYDTALMLLHVIEFLWSHQSVPMTGRSPELSPVPNTFLWNHTTFIMRCLMHLLKWWIWQWTAK
jgi:hypothetical protein